MFLGKKKTRLKPCHTENLPPFLCVYSLDSVSVHKHAEKKGGQVSPILIYGNASFSACLIRVLTFKL